MRRHRQDGLEPARRASARPKGCSFASPPADRARRRLAKETQASCKLSGLVTEAAEGWSLDDLRPYADHVLQAFGAERVMWGSDWPVCQLRATYDDLRTAAEALTAHLGTADRDRIFGGTAIEFYRLEV